MEGPWVDWERLSSSSFPFSSIASFFTSYMQRYYINLRDYERNVKMDEVQSDFVIMERGGIAC